MKNGLGLDVGGKGGAAPPRKCLRAIMAKGSWCCIFFECVFFFLLLPYSFFFIFIFVFFFFIIFFVVFKFLPSPSSYWH